MRQFIFSVLPCALAFFVSVTANAQQIEFANIGVPVDVASEPGIPLCSQCLEIGCDGTCHLLSRRMGFYGGAVFDIPLSGIFQAESLLASTAGGLGVDPTVLPGATQLNLMFEEQGFDDIYDGLIGYSANITVAMDRSTNFYVGFRDLYGRADPIEVGQAVVDPLGAATTDTITAQFDDYQEWAVQVGFLTSRAMHRKFELLWGGRGSVAVTDAISGSFAVPNVLSISDVPFYQESTILSFGVNLGLRYNLKPNISLVAVSGAEYRTSLDEDDTVLPSIGMGNLNNGSGMVTLPILVGGTIKF